jgi:hypothetical protein
MAHRNVVAIDRVGGLVAGVAGRQVRDDLVAVEVEIDPFVRGTPLGAAEQRAVEVARLLEAVDRKGEVEER